MVIVSGLIVLCKSSLQSYSVRRAAEEMAKLMGEMVSIESIVLDSFWKTFRGQQSVQFQYKRFEVIYLYSVYWT